MGTMPKVRRNYDDQTDTKTLVDVGFVQDRGPVTVEEEEANGGYNHNTQPTGIGQANQAGKGTVDVAGGVGTEED